MDILPAILDSSVVQGSSERVSVLRWDFVSVSEPELKLKFAWKWVLLLAVSSVKGSSEERMFE